MGIGPPPEHRFTPASTDQTFTRAGSMSQGIARRFETAEAPALLMFQEW
jgi:hypothetical protein